MKDNIPLDDTTPDPNNTEQETTTSQRPTTEPQKEKKNSTPGTEGKEPNEDDIVLPSVIEMTDDELFFSGKAFLDLVSGTDRKSTRLNSSHIQKSRMPSSA